MKNKSLENAMRKAGATVTCEDNRAYRAVKGSQLVMWYKQEDSAVCVHTPSRHTDIMTDCHCDRFHKTVKSAVQAIG